MNRYPLWKYLLIVALVAFSFIYAAPNLYAPDPAIQISGSSSAMVLDESVLDRARKALDEGDVANFGGEVTEKNALLRLKDREQQLRAKALIQQALGRDYVVALNLASTTPDWLADLGGNPMKLGLDLSGGIHFLMQVDTGTRIKQEMETRLDSLRTKLREDKIRYVGLVDFDENLQASIRFRDQENLDLAKAKVRSEFRDLSIVQLPPAQQSDDEFSLIVQLSEAAKEELIDSAVKQNLTSLKNRVNELGVSEPIVQRQGKDRIVVQLPGVQDTAEAKRIIDKTATLEFRLKSKDETGEVFSFKDNPARTAKLERRAIIGGQSVTGARAGFDENGRPAVHINLDSDGGAKMHAATSKNVKWPMAILFVENKSRIETRINADGEEEQVVRSEEEKSIISMPVIQSALGVQFQVTGLDSMNEAQELSLLLRAGALAAPMVIVEERTIGPSLGAENIELGITSVTVGMLLVLAFMLVYYKVFGLFANVALVMNLVILVAAMSMFGATLTLPGIAGIVLTVGMAVDANVLIFSRIKEELANGLPPQSAISSGYDRAFVSIFDANITTLIVALILFFIGSGPVQGFAVTLSIGIITSMFTAIMGTRAMVNLVYGRKARINKLWI
ncbi:protein translocase subunit SecD [Porticoccaceae bacterium LTM1]|nr:protein translocase subunit SecD [Porticoccaceae bacterium LTM1]